MREVPSKVGAARRAPRGMLVALVVLSLLLPLQGAEAQPRAGGSLDQSNETAPTFVGAVLTRPAPAS